MHAPAGVFMPSGNPYINPLLAMADGPPYTIDVTDDDQFDDGFEHEFALVPGPDGTLVECDIVHVPAPAYVAPPPFPLAMPRRPMTPRPGTPTLAPPARPTPTTARCAGWFSAPRGVGVPCTAHPACASLTMVRCDHCYGAACADHCALAPGSGRQRLFACARCTQSH
jgi:hypothetical protein